LLLLGKYRRETRKKWAVCQFKGIWKILKAAVTSVSVIGDKAKAPGLIAVRDHVAAGKHALQTKGWAEARYR
jgi:hypothetical protein